MRVDAINAQSYPVKQRQKQKTENNYFSRPILSQNNENLYFKSLEGVSNANKALINSSRNIAFSGASKALAKVTDDVPLTVVHSSVRLLQDTLLPTIEAKAEAIKALGHFGSVNSVKALYKGKKPKTLKKLVALEAAGKGNQAKIEQLYHEFAIGNLLTLAGKGEKEYTAFWARNKKLGRRSLVNFWLEKAGMNPTGKTPAQKAKMLNELSHKKSNY